MSGVPNDLARARARRALTTDDTGHYTTGIFDSGEVALDFDGIRGHGPIRLALSPELAREIAHYLILQAERVEAIDRGEPDPWPVDPNLPAGKPGDPA